MVDDPENRSTWAFPALMPFRVYDYPIPAVMPTASPPRPQGWPRAMDPGAAAFERRTAHVPSANQIYIHVPFCPFRCSFCAFYKDTDRNLTDRYVEGLLREIDMYARVPRLADRGYDAVYFGGGTPTELSPEQFARILGSLRDTLRLAPDIEISLEGIAEDMVRPGYLEQCKELGFTRIAFGVQSLDPVVRKAIGRGPDSVEAYAKAVEVANQLGLPANVELIMGCPEQTEQSLQNDLNEVISWRPGSVDVSSYIMVPGTNLFQGILRGSRAQPGYGTRLLRMRQLTFAAFRAAGYRAARAEVFIRNDTHRFLPSSPAMVGNSLHTHLAFGPSAIGHIDGTPFRNLPDLVRYLAAMEAGCFPVGRAERLTFRTAARRALLFAIGAFYVPDALITTWWQRKLFQRWEARGLVERVANAYRLSERGMQWENQLQISVLGITDALKAVRMFGSYDEQERLLNTGSELGRELLEQIGGGSELKKVAYKATLKVLKHAPLVDKKPIGLMGTLESGGPTST